MSAARRLAPFEYTTQLIACAFGFAVRFSRLEMSGVRVTASAAFTNLQITVSNCVIPSGVDLNAVSFIVAANSTLGTTGSTQYSVKRLTVRSNAYVSFDAAGSISLSALAIDAPAGLSIASGAGVDSSIAVTLSVSGSSAVCVLNLRSSIVLSQYVLCRIICSDACMSVVSPHHVLIPE